MKSPPTLPNAPVIDGVPRGLPVPKVSMDCPLELSCVVPTPKYTLCAEAKPAPKHTESKTGEIDLSNFNLLLLDRHGQCFFMMTSNFELVPLVSSAMP